MRQSSLEVELATNLREDFTITILVDKKCWAAWLAECLEAALVGALSVIVKSLRRFVESSTGGGESCSADPDSEIVRQSATCDVTGRQMGSSWSCDL